MKPFDLIVYPILLVLVYIAWFLIFFVALGEFVALHVFSSEKRRNQIYRNGCYDDFERSW
jgi:hypothetical protein